MKNAQESDKTGKACRFGNVYQAWLQYKSVYPGDEECLQEILVRALKAGLLRCRRCGLVQAEASDLCGRFFRCQGCQMQIWITGECIFRSVRNLQVWLGAIWLIERGVTFNAFDLHKVAEVAYSSAWNIFRKLSIVIESELKDDSLIASSALLAAFVCKRSRETKARLHPRSEEDNADGEQKDNERGPRQAKRAEPEASEDSWFSAGTEETPDFADVTAAHNVDTNNAANASKGGISSSSPHSEAPVKGSCADFVSTASADCAAQILQLLVDGPLHFDQLCDLASMTAGTLAVALSILEIDGMIEAMGGARFRIASGGKEDEPRAHRNFPPRVLSNRLAPVIDFADAAFYRGEPSGANSEAEPGLDDSTDHDSSAFRQVLSNLLLFLKHNFHGVSRKYLQMYLMAFWTRADRQFWSPGSLIDACLQFESITSEYLERYISPKLCKIVPLSIVAHLTKGLPADVRILPTTSGG
jgi:hypothetical protein